MTCPKCGYSLTRDEPVAWGDLTLEPTFACYRGVRLKLSAGEAGIVYALAKAKGRPIGCDALANRIIYSSQHTDDPTKGMVIMISKLRKKVGTLMKIKVLVGEGYYLEAA